MGFLFVVVSLDDIQKEDRFLRVWESKDGVRTFVKKKDRVDERDRIRVIDFDDEASHNHISHRVGNHHRFTSCHQIRDRRTGDDAYGLSVRGTTGETQQQT